MHKSQRLYHQNIYSGTEGHPNQSLLAGERSTFLQPPTGIRMECSTLPGAGRGIFAARDFDVGELIESCPVIALPDSRDRARLRRTGLINYYFLWGPTREHAAICLGYGSLYNHSYEPNARWEKRIEDERMDFYAVRPIQKGEEITVNYNGYPEDSRKLWIDAIPPANMLGKEPFSLRHPLRFRAMLAGTTVLVLAAASIHIAL